MYTHAKIFNEPRGIVVAEGNAIDESRCFFPLDGISVDEVMISGEGDFLPCASVMEIHFKQHVHFFGSRPPCNESFGVSLDT